MKPKDSLRHSIINLLTLLSVSLDPSQPLKSGDRFELQETVRQIVFLVNYESFFLSGKVDALIASFDAAAVVGMLLEIHDDMIRSSKKLKIHPLREKWTLTGDTAIFQDVLEQLLMPVFRQAQEVAFHVAGRTLEIRYTPEVTLKIHPTILEMAHGLLGHFKITLTLEAGLITLKPLRR